MSKAEIETFGIEVAETAARERLEEISRWPGVRKIVALPDIHQKRHLEAPTSIAVATKDVVIPSLTTPTLGCSMGIIATKLSLSDIDKEFMEKFFERMRKHLVFSRPSRVRTFFQWLGVIKPLQGSYDFTRQEVERAAKSGGLAVVEKYNFDRSVLDNFEYAREELPDLDGLIPRSGWQFSRSNIGYGFHGNHFLELQYVDEIIDEETANNWGIKRGQVLVSYHGGEGPIAFFVGRYFSRKRIKYSWREELMRLPAKLLFHKNLTYMGSGTLSLNINSKEGGRYMRAITAARNFSVAFRLAMIRRIVDALGTEARLLWDTSHTTITREEIEGEQLIIHRNGAVKIVPGKPVLISGSDKVRSYLGVGSPNTGGYLNSADHGAGETIKKMGGEGHDYIVKILEHANLVRPVAYIKPIATFRDK